MHTVFAPTLIALQVVGAAASVPAPPVKPVMAANKVDAAPAAAPEPAPTLPSDDTIRQAVREALAANPEAEPPHKFVRVLRADKYEVFAAEFAEARVPDCLHGDALKRQPAAIGPIAFVGAYAIPFVILAKLRGKCN